MTTPNGFQLKSDVNNIKVWVKDGSEQAVIEYPDNSFFAANHNPDGGWQNVNGWHSEKTFEAAAALLDGTQYQPVVIPPGYAMTSTGDVVLQADWDDIEGAM